MTHAACLRATQRVAVRLGILTATCWLGSLVCGVPADLGAAENVQNEAGESDSGRKDTVEFLNQTTVSGRITEIRKPEKEFDIELKIGSGVRKVTFPYSQVHAVTYRGKRFELTPMPESSQAESGKDKRTKSDVLELIQKAGNSPPEWFASTKLNHPDSLDLTWPIKTSGPWNESKNIGQYIWGRVNPNQGRWHAGIKLVHHCMELHQSQPVLLQRDMAKLGTMYFTLLQDYARAAFWFQNAKVTTARVDGIRLAECYWRLGNEEMALKMLKSKRLPYEAIKLYGQLGKLDDALRLAKAFQATQISNQAWLAAADALRNAGRLDEATEIYQRVVDANNFRNKEYEKRLKAQARQSIEAIKLFDTADISKVVDGEYRASSIGYNGTIEVEVVVEKGRIVQVNTIKHREKQFYAALTDTPRQIIENQSLRDVDATSGATITSQALIHATATAIAKGAR